MTNLAIELHDSQVRKIEREEGNLVLWMSAYMHKSDGRPGVDQGTGWRLPMRLVVENGSFNQPFSYPMLEISDGRITVPERLFANVIPLPFGEFGPIQLRFVGAQGELVISGDRIYIEQAGPETYLDEYPGMGNT